jgi:hypothetical protein
MKILRIIYIIVASLLMLLCVACSGKKAGKTDPKLIGVWKSKTDGSLLKITEKQFTMESDAPDPEDYFVKGDTIYTSFEGNLPYTKYAIVTLDEHALKLFTPDSTSVEFTK